MSACASMDADAGVAAGDDRLEALRLDHARRQRVVGAGHQHELLAGHDGAEFFSGAHWIPPSPIEPSSSCLRAACSASKAGCTSVPSPIEAGFARKPRRDDGTFSASRDCRLPLQPRLRCRHALLPRDDLVGVLERQPDVVETFEQAHAVGRRDVERDVGAARAADGLRLQIDRERRRAVRRDDARARMRRRPPARSTTGSKPFCRQFSR